MLIISLGSLVIKVFFLFVKNLLNLIEFPCQIKLIFPGKLIRFGFI